ncbi:MAG: hypothetical protein IT459_18435 [Planctomycetes bacterium]|nr:hypothetical protein [Planctomycetota bacterium]
MADAPTSSRTSKSRARVVVAIATPLVLVALLEFVVVTLGLAPPAPAAMEIWDSKEDRQFTDGASAFRFRREWLWEPRPGAEIFGDRINDDGYRGPRAALAKTPERLRIATLGDSTTFGFGLPERDSWSRRLEDALRARGIDAEVLNFGCVGYTLAQGTALLHGRVRAYEPDVVILAFGAVNEQFAARSGMTDAEKILFLASVRARAAAFLTRYATVRWIRTSFSRSEVSLGGDSAATATKARVPLAEFPTLFSIARHELPPTTKLVLVSPPRRADGESNMPATLDYTRSLLDTAQRMGLACANVYDVFRDRDVAAFGAVQTKTLAQHATSPLFIDPWHPSADGHALYANTVLDALVANGLIPEK